jgi:lycopene cyclase domain-containing protein
MTYLAFHLVFMAPALLLAGLAARGATRALGRRVAWTIPLLAAVALVWTAPWDNYLVARGIWSYGEDRVLGTIGRVPVEEYLFFLLQPLFTSWLLCALLVRGGHRSEPRQLLRHGLVTGMIAWLAVTAAGVLALRTPHGTYLGLILVWAGPVAAAQWALGHRAIRRRVRSILLAVTAATLYLCIADGIAIGQGIWHISPHTSTGLLIFGLPVEEAVFFLLTNVLVAQGLVLFIGPPRVLSAR